MRKHFLYFFCLSLLCIQCKKENSLQDNLLAGKWQFYMDAITFSGTDACQYRSKPADFYDQSPFDMQCKKDDVWEFKSTEVIFSSGKEKCAHNEPDTRVWNYEKTDSTLTIDGTTYHIVMLTRDTLIIDQCAELSQLPGLPPVGPQPVRIGTKLLRLK